MRLLLPFVAVACPFAWACATAPPEWAPPLVDDVKRASFPELAGTPLRVCNEDERHVGGRALFAPSSLWAGEPRARDYQVCFNAAVTGDVERRYVAAHELAHIVDYASRDTPRELWAFLVEIAATPWRSERRADVIVLERGYADELVAYRRWQREWMRDAPDALAARKRNYFTPNEARAADDVRRRCPDVFATFRERPPSDLRAILVHCP